MWADLAGYSKTRSTTAACSAPPRPTGGRRGDRGRPGQCPHRCRSLRGAGQPAARSSPSAASSASRPASATSWCTREGDSPAAAARTRIEIPLGAGRDQRPRPFPPGLFQPPRGPGDPRQHPPFPPGRLDPLADRHPPSLPAVFRKLDAVAVLTARLLPAPAGVAGVIAGAGFQCVTRRGMLEGIISYRNDNGAWLNAAGDHAPAVATSAHSPGMDAEMTLCMALEDLWI